LLVDRAKQANLIGRNSDLLVVGAGACGASAALHAADLGVTTVLIDRAAGVGGAPAFPLQAGCPSRWIDPTQYNRPSDHWAGGVFPWTGATNMDLPWEEDSADKVAVR
jgi:glycine/D-amino acid oxidase-like deaminating enzyme